MSLREMETPNAEPSRRSSLRVFSWLIRREFWEHRALWIAPLSVAAFAVAVHFLTVLTISDADRIAALADPTKSGPLMSPHAAIMGMVIVTGQLVGILYALDALQSERRDRSILFWKSLPVSDRATVLSKAFVVMVALPVLSALLAVAASIVAVSLQTLAWQLGGYAPARLWDRLDMGLLWFSLAYALPFMILWNAPLYGWFLLASAWAKRVAFLWAAAPIAGLLIVEHTVLHKTGAHWLVERRIAGGILESFTLPAPHDGEIVWVRSLAELDPLRLWTLPGLWIGVGVAVAFLWAAIRLRHSRPPL
jgi:ABC-2 type transport system permease protein